MNLIGVSMPPAPEQIACPRNPDHGMTTKRWLPPEERELLTKVKGDVYAVKCPHCGEYEWCFDPPRQN
jgi:hypothetical protein